ncbi:uncharacterized protein [Physcomitrium patens]|uniref:uncharacterized protein n=1 Tax=Physcomitrium patens TaxID=3218 RepID=UPI003CCDA026
MKGSICVAYNRPDQGLRSDVLDGLVLKDGVSDTRHTFRAEPFPLVLQVAILPMLISIFDESGVRIGQDIKRVVARPSHDKSDAKAIRFRMVHSRFLRRCDICETLITGQRGWHCNVCNEFDMCETCFKESETENWEPPPPHRSGHPMSVFQAPNPAESEPILMPNEQGVYPSNWGINWGYVVYDYPTMRWCETFDFIR